MCLKDSYFKRFISRRKARPPRPHRGHPDPCGVLSPSPRQVRRSQIHRREPQRRRWRLNRGNQADRGGVHQVARQSIHAEPVHELRRRFEVDLSDI